MWNKNTWSIKELIMKSFQQKKRYMADVQEMNSKVDIFAVANLDYTWWN